MFQLLQRLLLLRATWEVIAKILACFAAKPWPTRIGTAPMVGNMSLLFVAIWFETKLYNDIGASLHACSLSQAKGRC